MVHAAAEYSAISDGQNTTAAAAKAEAVTDESNSSRTKEQHEQSGAALAPHR